MWNLLRQTTRWVLNQSGHKLNIRASIERLAPGLNVLEKELLGSLDPTEKVRVEEIAEPFLQSGMPETLAHRAASLHLLYPALDVVETAAQRDSDVLDVALVFFGLDSRLRLKWLRENVEKLTVEGHWHAHARGNLRDKLYAHQRKLAAEVLANFSGSGDPVDLWVNANNTEVGRFALMMNDMHELPSMDYATVSVAVHSLDQLIQATKSS